MKKLVFGKIILAYLFSISSFGLSALEKGSVSEVYFSPQDGVAERLITYIKREKRSIRIAIYSLMHSGIAKALAEASARGVDVEVILDPYSIKSRSPVIKMVKQQVPVYVWSPRQRLGKEKKPRPVMHDKFCIFGDCIVWTGSFNFTKDATCLNRENVIVVEGAEVARAYLDEFEEMKEMECYPYQLWLMNK